MMDEMIRCPICGMCFDADYAEGEIDICPYCARENEVRSND